MLKIACLKIQQYNFVVGSIFASCSSLKFLYLEFTRVGANPTISSFFIKKIMEERNILVSFFYKVETGMVKIWTCWYLSSKTLPLS
jgi:hypothetical protein